MTLTSVSVAFLSFENLSEINVGSDIIRLLLGCQPEQVLCIGKVPDLFIHMAQVVMDLTIVGVHMNSQHKHTVLSTISVAFKCLDTVDSQGDDNAMFHHPLD